MNRFLALPFALPAVVSPVRAWLADNGNGTFTNPLFYDEFSDPDMIRVGDDYYLTGTTMHTMPGLAVLHSKDLVNWEFLGYASDGLNFGPEFRLEDGKSVYGQGIWAPSFRYHNGTFYIFTNINHRKTQLYTATNPAGPWKHQELKRSFHDLSVLFDDDGKVYVVWAYGDVHLAQLTDDLLDIVPGTERVIIPKSAGMGEGSHFYKINGKYFITSAWFAGRMRMPCARADKPEGPYEVNLEISADEEFGIPEGNRLVRDKAGVPYTLRTPDPKAVGRMSLHQGGLVDTPKGEWWGFSMMDYNSIGRLTCLSPVTWQDGWPYFGLPGNLKRTPRTWVKPDTGHTSPPSAPYQRNDEFNGPHFANVWQWNHFPVADKWSLTERPGFLRLHSLPAPDFWNARNTLTQRAIGPESTPTAELDASGLKPGDVAGLALLNHPYAWIGVSRSADGFELRQFDETTGKTVTAPFAGGRVWLRAHCDFLTEKAAFSYSTDGKTFQPLGGEFTMIFQGLTFQGIRYSLFNYNTGGAPGGCADFDRFTVDEPRPSGFTRPIPAGKTIVLENMRGDDAVLAVKGDALTAAPKSDTTAFKVIGLPLGRVSLQAPDGRFVTVAGLGENGRVSLERAKKPGDDSQSFQWTEMPRGDLLLLSLTSHRHLRKKNRDPGGLGGGGGGEKGGPLFLGGGFTRGKKGQKYHPTTFFFQKKNTPSFKKIFVCGCAAIALVPNLHAAESPREHLSLDANWKFHLGDDWPNALHLDKAGASGGPASEKFNDNAWRALDLPHDWAVELPFDKAGDVNHGYRAVGPGFETNSIGWYRRTFELPKEDEGKRIWLTFDGVFRDATVWVNGWLVRRHEGGYYPFREDITDVVKFGGKNVIAVLVDATKVRGLVLRRRGHLPPRLAGQDRAGGHRAGRDFRAERIRKGNVPEG